MIVQIPLAAEAVILRMVADVTHNVVVIHLELEGDEINIDGLMEKIYPELAL